MNTNNVSTDPLTTSTDNSISGISQDTIQISADALTSNQNSNKNGMFASVLDSLVSNGTLTQDQKIPLQTLLNQPEILSRHTQIV